jgi:hypothetical protein
MADVSGISISDSELFQVIFRQSANYFGRISTDPVDPVDKRADSG